MSDSNRLSTPTSRQAAEEQAEILAHALPFLRRYAGATIVVKYGGHAMGEEHLADMFGRDIALLKQVGVNPVVVHGGGPQINTMLKRLAIQSTFVDGLRVTDEAMVEVVEMVLAGTVNKRVAGLINRAGALAVGLCGKDGGLIRARKLTRTKKDPDSNIERVLDLGFVGEPEYVDVRVIHALTGAGLIPAHAPLTWKHHKRRATHALHVFLPVHGPSDLATSVPRGGYGGARYGVGFLGDGSARRFGRAPAEGAAGAPGVAGWRCESARDLGPETGYRHGRTVPIHRDFGARRTDLGAHAANR